MKFAPKYIEETSSRATTFFLAVLTIPLISEKETGMEAITAF